MQFSYESVTQSMNLMSTFIVSLTGLVVAISAVIRPARRWLVEQFTNRKEIRENMALFKTELKNMRDLIQEQNDKSEADRIEQAIMKEATQATVRNELTEIYYRSVERGYIDDYDRDNFEKMYIVYTKLGGNSYIHTIHKLIMEMPNKLVAKKKKAAAKRTATKKTRGK